MTAKERHGVCRGLSRRAFIQLCAVSSVGLFTVDAVRAAMSKKELPAVDLAFLSSKVTLKRRTAWTKIVPKPWILKEAKKFDRITVHHSGGKSNSKTDKDIIDDIEAICVQHRERGFGDIGYHFVIDRAGTVWEARSLAYEGAHVQGQNENNIGIVLLGNYEEQEPTNKQKQSLKALISALRDKYQIKKHRLFGHRELGKTVCPGKNLFKYVKELRKPEETAEEMKGGEK